MAVLFSSRLQRIERLRVVTLAAGLVALALGLLLWSAQLGALGGMLVLLGCGLFAYEVHLAGFALRPLLDETGQIDRSTASGTLEQMLDLPLAAEAWAAAPEYFSQVRFLDQVPDGGWSKRDVPQYVGIDKEGGQWAIWIADELFANLDLDVNPKDDPLCQFFLADARVQTVSHPSRETYWISMSVSVSLEEFAAMTVRGLVAHHMDARARLLGA